MDVLREQEFESFLRDAAQKATDAVNYTPRYFLASLAAEGAFNTVNKLLSPGRPPSDGFVRLWKEGRLELSVEALVLESEWHSYFDDETLAAARRRLREVGYSVSEHVRSTALPAAGAATASVIPIEPEYGRLSSPRETDQRHSYSAARRVWKVSGPPENFLVAVQRKHWALNEKNKNAWARLAAGDIIVFHSTRSSGELHHPPSVVLGFARVGPRKFEKSEFWWPTELSERKNHWPYAFDLDAICLTCQGLPLNAIVTPLSIASPEEKAQWLASLLRDALPIGEIERIAKAKDPSIPNFPVNGSIAQLNDVYESVILGDPTRSWTLASDAAEAGSIENSLLSEEDAQLIDEQSIDLLLKSASAFKDPSGPSHENRTVKVRIESATQKRRIAAIENFSCQVCGYRQRYVRASGRSGWIIHVDHIIDKAKGGGEEMCNLWVLCPNCHAEKTLGVLTIDPETHEVNRAGKCIDIRDNHLRLSR